MKSQVDIIKKCECGCDETIHYIGRHQRIPKYRRGHNVRGKMCGSNNPFYGRKWTKEMLPPSEKRWNWSGDKPKYHAVHAWVKRNWPSQKPNNCSICGEVKRLDLANIRIDINDETYNRDFNNWIWICRRCHLISDKRAYNNLIRPWQKSV